MTIQLGFIPPPFVYDTMDTNMDWFNTAYWSNNPGAYDVWGSIYPPISFIFLKIFSIHSCYHDDPFFGRHCDWLGRVTLFSFFIANFFIVFKAYRVQDGTTAIVRTLALCLGLPMVFALDRGNLIVPCFTAFALAHGRVVKSARLRWLALATSINFKPYLIATILPLFVRRRWRAAEAVVLMGLVVYLVSWSAFGAGSPVEVVGNILSYQQDAGNTLFGGMFYGGSYSSMVTYMTAGLPIMTFVGSRVVELIDWLPHALIQLGQAGVMASFLGAALRPHAVATFRLTALAVALAISTVEVGGYAQVFLLFLVFMERWRGPASIVALVAAYALCVPLDHMVVTLAHQTQSVYLTGRTVGYDLGLSVGMFVRPGLILLIEYALVVATLIDVVRAGPLPTTGTQDPAVSPEAGFPRRDLAVRWSLRR